MHPFPLPPPASTPLTVALIGDPAGAAHAQLARYLPGFQMRLVLASAVDASELQVDVILLEQQATDRLGLDWCARLRRRDVGVLMLTHGTAPADRVLALESGADDCLAVPFDARELVARIRAVHRRLGRSRAMVRFADWVLDVEAQRLQWGDRAPVALSRAELRLLRTFLAHPGQVLEREQLHAEEGAAAGESIERSVDLQISRLRQKLGDDPRAPSLIRTVRGRGYLFDASPTMA